MAKAEIYIERRKPNGTYLSAKLELPANKYEIADILQRIQSDGSMDYSITSFDHFLTVDLPEKCRLDELNFFVARLENMSDFDLHYFQSKIYFDEPPPDMRRLINMTFNSDYLEAMPAGDYKTIGEVYLDSNMFPEINHMSDELLGAIDLDKVGRIVAEKEGGKLLQNDWYAFLTGKEFVEVYDGVKLPEITDEGDYVFKFLVAEAPVNHSEETIDKAVWITLPGDMDEFNRLANAQNERCIQDCVYFEMKSTIPQINSEVFGDMADFETLHEIAERYAEMNTAGQIHYKATLEYAGFKTIHGCRNALDHMDVFSFRPDLCSLNDLGQWLMRNSGALDKNIKEKDMSHIGKTLLDIAEHGKITHYGYMVVNPNHLDISQLDKPTEPDIFMGDIYSGADFGCEQTGGFPTLLCWNKDENKAWLEPNTSFGDDSEGAKQCLRDCADWGVRSCFSWEDYNDLLKSIGEEAYENAAVPLDDEDETEEMGGMELQ